MAQAYTGGNHGISKDDAVTKLKELGYDVFYDKGVVYVIITGDDPEVFYGKFEKDCKKVDYRMSRGCVRKRSGNVS